VNGGKAGRLPVGNRDFISHFCFLCVRGSRRCNQGSLPAIGGRRHAVELAERAGKGRNAGVPHLVCDFGYGNFGSDKHAGGMVQADAPDGFIHSFASKHPVDSMKMIG